MHRNQVNLYLILALVAFRKEIFHFLIQCKIIPTKIDPDTNQRRLDIKWSTDGLKLLLVGQMIWFYFIPSDKSLRGSQADPIKSNKNQNETNKNETHVTQQQDETDETQITLPILPLLIITTLLLLLLFNKNSTSFLWSHPYLLPLITSFVFKSIQNNPDSILSQILSLGSKDELAIRQAYIPQLEQHYTFEQLNERYYRDWAGWRKAFGVNTGVVGLHRDVEESYKDVSGFESNRKSKVSSILSTLMHPGEHLAKQQPGKSSTSKLPLLTDTYPREYNNGTVIVLDMTKLDTQASRMEVIKDQISFLLHLLEYEDGSFFSSTDSTAVNATECPMNETASAARNSNNTINATSDTLTNTTNATPPKHLEVIILLESPGGAVSSYGLASSHLQRLRSNPHIKLTICIDSIAASGGYMMACMATPGQLYCAPFAMVGSIGVIGQSLNVQKTLEKYGVRPYVFRGGRMKNPVGMVGDVTKEGIGAMQDMVDRIHDAFRRHVADAREGALMEALRPVPDGKYFGISSDVNNCESGVMGVIDQVANGDVYLGIQAKKLGLVDRLITSDEYISERIRHGARVLKLIICQKPVTLTSFLAGHPAHRSPHVVFGGGKGLFSRLFGAFLNVGKT